MLLLWAASLKRRFLSQLVLSQNTHLNLATSKKSDIPTEKWHKVFRRWFTLNNIMAAYIHPYCNSCTTSDSTLLNRMLSYLIEYSVNKSALFHSCVDRISGPEHIFSLSSSQQKKACRIRRLMACVQWENAQTVRYNFFPPVLPYNLFFSVWFPPCEYNIFFGRAENTVCTESCPGNKCVYMHEGNVTGKIIKKCLRKTTLFSKENMYEWIRIQMRWRKICK